MVTLNVNKGCKGNVSTIVLAQQRAMVATLRATPPASMRKTRTQNSLHYVVRWFNVRIIMYLDILFNSLAAIVVTASDKRGGKAWVRG